MNIENLRKYGELQRQYDYQVYRDSEMRFGDENSETMDFDEWCEFEEWMRSQHE